MKNAVSERFLEHRFSENRFATPVLHRFSEHCDTDRSSRRDVSVELPVLGLSNKFLQTAKASR